MQSALFIVLGIAGFCVSAWLVHTIWGFGGVLDEVYRSAQAQGLPSSQDVHQSAIALSLQSSSAMISALLAAQSLGLGILRVRESPAFARYGSSRTEPCNSLELLVLRPNKALQLTPNSAFQLELVAFWHQHRSPSSASEALLAAAERLIR